MDREATNAPNPETVCGDWRGQPDPAVERGTRGGHGAAFGKRGTGVWPV